MDTDYELLTDGGSQQNGSPTSHAYGSYRIRTKTHSEIIRVVHESGATNNMAEYLTVIDALEDLVARIEKRNRNTQEFSVRVITDSALVVNQVKGAWGVKEKRLKPLVAKVKVLLGKFKEWDIVHVPRRQVVSVLGH